MRHVKKNVCENVVASLFKRYLIAKETRMAIFIKTKFNKSDDQTNIENIRVAANITEYQN